MTGPQSNGGNVAWEQFKQKQLDGRLQIVAGYLANKIEGMNLFDLNCGTAPLLDWLPPVWNWYAGNDTCKEFIMEAIDREKPRCSFDIIDDESLPSWLNEEFKYNIDCLIVMGYAARLNPMESQTIEETIYRLVDEHQPEIVVLDGWAGLPNDVFFQTVVSGLSADFDYKIEYAWFLRPVVQNGTYQHRDIYFLEKDA